MKKENSENKSRPNFLGSTLDNRKHAQAPIQFR